jgi:hypothetical protein
MNHDVPCMEDVSIGSKATAGGSDKFIPWN